MSVNLKKPTLIQRVCSRIVDYCLLFAFGTGVSLFLPYEVNTLFYVLFGVAVPALFIPLEALFLSRWGKTPGKALFGLELKEKPPFKKALFRKRGEFLAHKENSFFRVVLAYGLTVFLLIFSMLSQNITTATIGGEFQQKQSGWVHYVAEEAGFHVNFPTKPELEEKKVALPRTSNPVNYSEYTSQKGPKVLYSVSYIDLPKKWSFVSARRILSGVFDVVMKLEQNSILINKEYTNHLSFPALNFHYQKGGDEVDGRLIRVGQRLFRLTVTYPASLADKPAPQDFLDSFHLGTPKES